MMESAEKVSINDFERQYGKISRKDWSLFVRDYYNFYYVLAKYARQKGLRVDSLEPSAGRTGSKLKAKRAKIQKREPKLVFAASGHVIYLKHAMKPKRVEWHNTTFNNPDTKTIRLIQREQRTKAYLEEKKLRRKQALKGTRFSMKKWWRPKA